MRQFFTWGFWLTLLSLAGITLGLVVLTRNDDPVDQVVAQAALPERQIDLIGMVFMGQADPGFDIVGGLTTATMQIRIDGYRFMNIPPGTPGENRCPALAGLARCAVVADLLGESVLWFSIVPLGARNLVPLPPVVSMRDGAKLELENGWVVSRADVVKRDCDDDTSSLSDFIERKGAGSTTLFSIDMQEVITVSCGVVEAGGPGTTTPAFVPASTIAPGTIAPGTIAPATIAPATIAPPISVVP